MSSQNDASSCFACGENHPYGLHLSFSVDPAERSVEARTILAAGFAGADGIAHGGIVATLLDEAAAHASRTVADLAATASLQVRYRKPTPVGVPLVVRSRVVSCRHGAVQCEAVVLHGGEVLAEGRATLLAVATSANGTV
jgi:acyl-coenzyme A thioesterase PaaI-like protein